MNPNKTAKLLKEINKLTNEIDKLLKSNTPRAKRMLKSLASKGRELGIIITDDLTDTEVGQVIKKADKKTKQALIYAIQNEIPNLKTLHKGKKNFKLDKAYATKSRLNFAIAPDKEPLPKSVREANKEKLRAATKLKQKMKKEAMERLKNEQPHFYNLLIQEEKYKKEEKARWRKLNIEERDPKKQRKEAHKRQIQALKAREKQIAFERQQSLNEERVNAILELKKSWDSFLNDKETIKITMDQFLPIMKITDFKDVFNNSKANLEKVATQYGFDPNLFLGLIEAGIGEKALIKTLNEHKFENAEATVKFLQDLQLADPYQEMYKKLFKELNKFERANKVEDLLYVLPQGKLNELDIEYKSGVTNDQLENLKSTLEIFKIIADAPTNLTEEKINQSVNIISVYAKLQILCVELMAKVMSVIQVTSTKVGGDSWDNKFWWFATYKSKAVLDDGHTWVDRGFVVDWKGVHIRVEAFLTEIERIVNASKAWEFDHHLDMWANDFRNLAKDMAIHYERYKNHVEEGDLGKTITIKNKETGWFEDVRVFNTEAFLKTARIGETYQKYLIQAQSWLTDLKLYCQEAIELAQKEIRRFAKNRYS